MHSTPRQPPEIAVVELPSSDLPHPPSETAGEPVDVMELERNHDRQRLRDKLAETGGLGGLGAVGSSGRMSPTPRDEPQFDVDRAIAEAGSADAALLAAVCRYASAAEVRALLEHGADPNTSFLNHSALALAVRCCSSQATTALLEARANVDNKDPQGWTALMHAIDAHEPAFSREHVLVQLLDAGAAVDVWGHDLRGPFELMEEKWKQEGSQSGPKDGAKEERRLTEKLMHQRQRSGPATVQLVPSDRSDDEGEVPPAAATAPLVERMASKSRRGGSTSLVGAGAATDTGTS